MTRIAAAFVLVGGIGGLASHFADPGDPTKAYVSVLATACGLAVALRAVTDRPLQLRFVHVISVVTTLLVGIGAATEEGRGVVLLIGVGMFTACFTTRRAASVHVGMLVLAIVAVEANERGLDPLMVGTLAVAVSVPTLVLSWVVDELGQVAGREQEARRQLEIVFTRKATFLAHMSRVLHSPLDAILRAAEAIECDEVHGLGERQSTYVRHIVSSGKHLIEVVDGVLEDRSGAERLDVLPYSVTRVVDQVVSVLGDSVSAAGVSLEVELDEGLDEMIGDERKLRQVLINLVTNAAQATSRGGSVRIVARRCAHGDVSVGVIDTGRGIDEGDRERIFEQYVRAGVEGDGGTGLGLAVSRRIVELHGGQLTVASEVGVGSTFTFTLPPRPPRSPAEPGVEVLLGNGAGDGPSPVDRRRMTAVTAGFLLAAGLVEAANIVADGAGVASMVCTVALLAGSLYAAASLRRGAPLPLWSIHLVVPLTAVLVAVGLAELADGRGAAILILPAVLAALFTWGRATAAHVVAVCVAIALGDVLTRGFDLVQLITLSCVLTTAAFAVQRIVGNLRSVADQERRAGIMIASLARHRSDVLAQMSHELRSPLNAVIGFADVLCAETHGPLSREQRREAEAISQAGRGLLELIDDLLQQARIESGQVTEQSSLGHAQCERATLS